MDSLHPLDPAADYLRIDRTTSADGRTVRLVLRGELDGPTAEVVDRAVHQALRTPVVRRVELHVSALTFIDSAGIHCLLTGREATDRAERQLILVDPSDPVRRVLEISGLAGLFGLARGTGPTSPRRAPRPPQSLEASVRESEMLRASARRSRSLSAAAIASAPSRAR